MFYIYALESLEHEEVYIGYTKNLKNRLQEHNQGLNFSTKRYRPWKIIYLEGCLNEDGAKRRENYLKTSQGRRLLKRRLKEYYYNKRKI